jgi:uncharacterized protein YndB with AHSA1/START domain
MTPKNNPKEIYITRIYDASLKSVWEAWIDPAQVSQWWGPRGFTLTTHSKDVRTGGTWVYTMHGPDGVNYPNITPYLEVIPYQRLVYDHGSTAETPPMFRVTALFSELQGKTNLEMMMTFENAEIASQTKKFIKQAGGDATWDRLAEFLAETQKQKNIFAISRTFEASLENIYRAWTEPNQLAKWLAPTGASMNFMKADIKVGGETLWQMKGDHGVMYGRARYLELVPLSRVAYTQQFVDEKENISRHPLAPTWPETLLTRVDFTAEENTRTRVTLIWEPHGQVTSSETETFKNARAGMTQGWTGSFDKLEENLLLAVGLL